LYGGYIKSVDIFGRVEGTLAQPKMNNGMVTFQYDSETTVETFIEGGFQPIFS